MGYPDVGAVEGHTSWILGDDQTAEVDAVTRAQFGDGAAERVSDPDVLSVKDYPGGTISGEGEGAQQRAVAGA